MKHCDRSKHRGVENQFDEDGEELAKAFVSAGTARSNPEMACLYGNLNAMRATHRLFYEEFVAWINRTILYTFGANSLRRQASAWDGKRHSESIEK